MTELNKQALSSLPRLKGLHHSELTALVEAAGFPAFRGKQVYHWLQKQGARKFSEMTNIPKALREWLEENTVIGGVNLGADVRQSMDGSFKFLFLLDDGKKVESVLMPDPKRGYWTLCLSSQVGCAVDCKFCVTGFNGFFRQMKADEIVDQVLYSRRYLLERQPEAIYRNLVFMGMGEPLLNTDEVIRAIRIITSHAGLDLSPRRITVSTSGITPGIEKLHEADLGVCLALSLNAPSQEERETIMPITKKYPLAELLNVLREKKFGRKGRVTFEYVLLEGVNDQEEHAERLADLIRGIPSKINLIPFNPHGSLPYGRPTRGTVDRFAKILLDYDYTVSVRWSKALDVDGACGQLAGDQRQRRGVKTAVTAGVQEFPADLDFFATVAAESSDDDD